METVLKIDCCDELGYWFIAKHRGLYGGGFGSDITGRPIVVWYSKDDMIKILLESPHIEAVPPAWRDVYQEFVSLAILKLVFEERE